jgi:hypothetical protein
MFSLQNLFRVVSTLLFLGSVGCLVWGIQIVEWYPLALAAVLSTMGTFGFILTHPAEWGH